MVALTHCVNFRLHLVDAGSTLFQIDAFDGTVHAALSAYNGGPGNAARWYGAAGDDIDLYVETVDFPETRSYIERIYSGYNIYRYLDGDS